jgi:hypothetical protein
MQQLAHTDFQAVSAMVKVSGDFGDARQLLGRQHLAISKKYVPYNAQQPACRRLHPPRMCVLRACVCVHACVRACEEVLSCLRIADLVMTEGPTRVLMVGGGLPSAWQPCLCSQQVT